MSNHNQLFVETAEANLAAGMQFLNGGCSDYRDVRKAWSWMGYDRALADLLAAIEDELSC
ncbi:MAG: hypothetical protein KJZ87_15920 [Thermoguttaceae bacterium]|nr:hypothetical protein [Thermoguttaceae bacterium]